MTTVTAHEWVTALIAEDAYAKYGVSFGNFNYEDSVRLIQNIRAQARAEGHAEGSAVP